MTGARLVQTATPSPHLRRAGAGDPPACAARDGIVRNQPERVTLV
ncbi:MAG TPA: hypothetical protein VE338_16135 [Ktedonobacterales bacterium]|jgi:hypothetical protein|nr:hypothetical protein [Ktedonobacterales bacterium]